MTVNGIDVAAYQSSDYATRGLDFVFVKATEGHSYTNPKHAAQVAAARAAGLLVGHYHFARAGSMSAQADYFLAHTAARPGDVLCLDWEDAAVSAADKDAWLRYVAAKAPEHRLVLYCGLNFWHRDTTSYCADGLWIADPSAPKAHPRVEHPWLFHQYSEAGGIDHNVGNFASRAALQRWAGTTSTEDSMTISAADARQIAEAVWSADTIPAARPPYANGDYAKGNRQWRAEYGIQTAVESARRAAAAAEQAVVLLGALTATVAALAKSGGLTAEQITTAAKVGAEEALAELGSALTKED